MSTNVLVYIELNDNKVENVTKEIISYVRDNFADIILTGFVISDGISISNAMDDIRSLPLEKIYLLKDEKFFRCESAVIAFGAEELINRIRPDILLVGATIAGREIAPRIASKMNIGLTADCTDLSLDENGTLLATRPTYGGKMMATIYSKTKPYAATIRPGAFKYTQDNSVFAPEIIDFNVDLSKVINRIQILKSELIKAPEDWTNADVIIAGGLGLQSKENFELLYDVCKKLDAKPAASRIAVERGWAPYDIQVGQTGKSVSPKLYIALGISGAMQHIVGITNADKIIAVNTDESAPIMSLADIAINKDAILTLKNMLEILD